MLIHASRRGQRGALLLVTLVFLLIVSLLAIATVDTTGLEMRMASNSRDQQQAFEAAEYTLVWVENDIVSRGGYSDDSLINSNCGSTCFDAACSNGYCFGGEDTLDWQYCKVDTSDDEYYTDPDLWADDSGRHKTLDVPNTGITTKYIIEYRCFTALNGAQKMDVNNNTKVYRITAYAVGEGGRGRAMLRSTIKLI